MNDRTLVLTDFKSPVDHYPASKHGKVEITKLRRGTRATYWAEGVEGKLFYKYATPATLTVLKINRCIWMVDEVPFVLSLASFAERSKGHVLVAGLGLGIVVHQLVKNPAVTRITVVDRDADVIALVKPLLPVDPRIKIVKGDFYLHVEKMAKRQEVPDTVIWDLGVARGGTITEGKEIAIVPVILAAKFAPPWIPDGEKWKPAYPAKQFDVFVHGIDRDPVGEKFVKTEEFKRALSCIRA